MNNETILIVFVAATAASVLMQACVLLALFITMRRTAKSMQDEISELRTTLNPFVVDAKDFLTRVGPKIDAITTDLAELTHGLRTQGEELQVSTSEILERVRRQSSRLDVMFSSLLDTVERAGGILAQAVNTPLRQVNAVAAFAKAMFGSFRNGPSPQAPQPTHSPADKDLFV